MNASMNSRASSTAKAVLSVIYAARIDKPCEAFFYLDARYVAAVVAQCRLLDTILMIGEQFV